jgi:putative membrane protein
MKKFLPAMALSAIALGMTACGSETGNQTDLATNQTAAIAADLSNAASNAVDAASIALKPTPTGQQFADEAARSDAFEIAASRLALTNAASDEIKTFASDMITAHTASTARIKAAAKQAAPAITPHDLLAAAQKSKLADLGKLKGAAFDQRYASEQVEAHKHALSLMEKYAKDGEVAPLKAAAAEIAPVVRQHLDEAKALPG